MYCSNCGAQNPDQAGFCTSCGQSLAANTAEALDAPAVDNVFESLGMRRMAVTCLILGGIACVAAWIPGPSIAGIILGSMAISKAKRIKAYFESISQKWPRIAQTGKIMGTVGLVVGILMTVIYVFYIVLVIIATCNPTGYSREILEQIQIF